MQPTAHIDRQIQIDKANESLYSVFKKFLFIYLFLAALGLRCCPRAFSSCGEQGLLFTAVRGLLIAVASLVVEHGLQVRGLQYLWHVGSVIVAPRLQSAGSVVVAHGFSCSAACGIFLDQGLNLCPLHFHRIPNHCATREVPIFMFFRQKIFRIRDKRYKPNEMQKQKSRKLRASSVIYILSQK